MTWNELKFYLLGTVIVYTVIIVGSTYLVPRSYARGRRRVRQKGHLSLPHGEEGGGVGRNVVHRVSNTTKDRSVSCKIVDTVCLRAAVAYSAYI